MQHSLCSTVIIGFITLCTVLTRPSYLAENLDTTLRLGTSNHGTIKISQLGKVDPLSSTLAPSFTISKLANPLDLTLGPTSELTTKNVVSPKNHKFSDTSGIQKTNLFKHIPQEKLSFGSTPDVETWLDHQNIHISVTKPVSHLLGDHHNTLPSNNLMLKPFLSSFLTQPLQGSGSRNLHIHQVPTHRLPRFSGPSSAQGIPTRDSSVQKPAIIKLDNPHPKIGPPFHPTQKFKVPEETKVPGTYSSRHEKLPSSRRKYQNVIDPHGKKTNTAIREDMSILSRVGKMVLKDSVAFGEGIKGWLIVLRDTLIQRIVAEKPVGIESSDIERAFCRAKQKFVPTFIGFLMTRYNNPSGKSRKKLLNGGWEYLKSYMNDWPDLNFEVAFKLKDIKVDSDVWEWTPDKLLIYMVWMDSRIIIFMDFLGEFTDSSILDVILKCKIPSISMESDKSCNRAMTQMI
ncbi:uncharacterized protein MELLADRAFT_102514 [Melampsora larici-populina 98AG31]|uniref:Secreted protein n=1 Tax=Melampsora larici-populina (strain 98AG31 / pathotype 3-4-7) TaxID=747676 RepID=F4R709_MELLP|nr:uncharacterized protein MELLADRAFT_102514 [Melampsora larici-populina 98AG31]EGG11494.1 hypothetical protein MELLADRAFT_102514 [Melampsora larici-populina 98AG31]